jgi:hypothetical protein
MRSAAESVLRGARVGRARRGPAGARLLAALTLALGLPGCAGDPAALPPPATLATPAADPPPAVPSTLQDVIEALFLGTGRLVPRDGGTYCMAFRQWVAFPEGTRVRIRISTNVPATAQDAIHRAADDVATATGGQVTALVETTGDADPRPGPDEVTVARHPDPRSQGCTFNRGCTLSLIRAGMLVWARVVLGPEMDRATAGYPHDAIGHGLLGACHIDGYLIGGADQSLMSGGPDVVSCATPNERCIALGLTPLDQEAARAVYAAGLARGAHRAAFVAAGLVRPELAAGAAARDTRRRMPGPRPGDEIVILDER